MLGSTLYKRSLRHALDKGSPDVLEATVSLAKHGSDPCIIASHKKVLASMKTVQYNSRSALTSTEFLAAECDCKAGDDNANANNLGACRIICTHCVTIPVQLSLLMF